MTERFVILHHVLRDGEHWDLMLERGEALLTWQLAADPTRPGSLPVAARRIADHRKAYLDYEGPISGDRGRVQRIESGVFEPTEWGDERVRVRLQGTLLRGQFELTRSGQDWVLGASSPR